MMVEETQDKKVAKQSDKVTMTKEEFVSYALKNLFKHKISVHLGFGALPPSDDTEISSNGYFSDAEKKLFCRIDDKEEFWFEIFLHEYCHFLQHRDAKYPNSMHWQDLDDWLLKKKNFPQKRVQKCVEVVRACELDCERRVIKLVKKFNLPVSIPEYTQRANVYILFYTLVGKHRRWYNRLSPYAVPELAKMMPVGFKKNWSTVPKEFEKIVVKKCFKAPTGRKNRRK
jgi:hypothetical protein